MLDTRYGQTFRDSHSGQCGKPGQEETDRDDELSAQLVFEPGAQDDEGRGEEGREDEDQVHVPAEGGGVVHEAVVPQVVAEPHVAQDQEVTPHPGVLEQLE